MRHLAKVSRFSPLVMFEHGKPLGDFVQKFTDGLAIRP
jgi:hypothetical protein